MFLKSNNKKIYLLNIYRKEISMTKQNNMGENNNTTKPVKRSGLVTAGFICSLFGFLTCGITSIIGLILSIIGLEDSKKSGKKDGLAIAGIVISVIPIAIIGLLITGVTDYDLNSNETTPSEKSKIGSKKADQEKSYTPIDIDVLETDLDNNAAAAKDNYKGKYLEITGRLGTIDSDLKYFSLLSTTDQWDVIGVHCSIKNEETKDVVKTLTKDQTIIVKGKITDVGEVLGYYLDIDEIIPQ